MTKNIRSEKFFAEIAYYPEGDAVEKIKAKEYLEYWKKNLLFKLSRDTYDVVLVDEQYIERPAYWISALAQYASIALKIKVDAVFYYDLELMNQGFSGAKLCH